MANVMEALRRVGPRGPLRRHFGRDGLERVRRAVEAAEARTTAEIAPVIVADCRGDVRARAEREAIEHGLDRTPERNAVVILLALRQHRYEIVADEGVAARVPDAAWQEIGAHMSQRLAAGDYAGGLVAAVERVGDVLAREFPATGPDTDDIPNTPVVEP